MIVVRKSASRFEGRAFSPLSFPPGSKTLGLSISQVTANSLRPLPPFLFLSQFVNNRGNTASESKPCPLLLRRGSVSLNNTIGMRELHGDRVLDQRHEISTERLCCPAHLQVPSATTVHSDHQWNSCHILNLQMLSTSLLTLSKSQFINSVLVFHHSLLHSNSYSHGKNTDCRWQVCPFVMKMHRCVYNVSVCSEHSFRSTVATSFPFFPCELLKQNLGMIGR